MKTHLVFGRRYCTEEMSLSTEDQQQNMMDLWWFHFVSSEKKTKQLGLNLSEEKKVYGWTCSW